MQINSILVMSNVSVFSLVPYAARHWVDHIQFRNLSSRIQEVIERLSDPAMPADLAPRLATRLGPSRQLRRFGCISVLVNELSCRFTQVRYRNPQTPPTAILPLVSL